MARMNISIPDDLKTRMDQVDLNWSSVAQEAFTSALEIATLKEQAMNTEAGISRLRTSKKANFEMEAAKGVAEGKQWALEEAEYEDVERIAGLTDRIEDEGDAKELLIEATTDDYGRGMFDDDISDGYAEGFIKGVAEVFRMI